MLDVYKRQAKYQEALYRLDEYSHIWLICWYTQKNPTLTVKPRHIDPDSKPFGVFALRSPNHPNPLALTLAKLDKIENNILFVQNVDSFDGTQVLDIKPYFEFDTVFSPDLPMILHQDADHRLTALWMLANSHHREACSGAALAVKMVLLAESLGFVSSSPFVSLTVKGSPCLADTLQGLSRARFFNPPRFYYEHAPISKCRFVKENQALDITVIAPFKSDTNWILTSPYEELFSFEISQLSLYR